MSSLKIKEAIKNTSKAKSIGGQAVIEGVMMRGEKSYAVAVRKQDQTIEIESKETEPISKKYKILSLPILRGVVSFIGSLVTGMRITMRSAEIAGIDAEDEKPSKLEIYLTEKFGEKKIMSFLVYLSVAIALVLSVGLFMLLPVFIGSLISPLLNGNTWALSIIEGFIRIFIFLCYIFLISRNSEIQRVFEYHGAEHKTINCYEANEELTIENVKNHTRLHKRCGTSFLLIVMIISMIVFLFLRTDVIWLRFASRIVMLPVIAGLSYEFIRFAGKSDSIIMGYLSYPGLMLQKATTKEPDDLQIETAIAAINEVLKCEG